MDPVSKRVFLISINGLGSDFLAHNATPFLKNMTGCCGFAGTIKSRFLDTNDAGMTAILTGRSRHPFFSTSSNSTDNILDHAKCKCVMSNTALNIPHLNCMLNEKKPFEYFSNFPKLFQFNNTVPCFYIINIDFDPVIISSYRSRLKEIDSGIRFLVNTVENVWDDNKTTYIVTSARGSPVGNSLTIDSPIVAWGKGIFSSPDVWVLPRNDITAMLCVLLGVSFPSDFVGKVPMSVMDISDYHRFEWMLYTIRHYEKVLGIVDHIAFQLLDSSELSMEQLFTRLTFIIKLQKRKALIQWCFIFLWVELLYIGWGIYLLTTFGSGQAFVSLTFKGLLPLVVMISSTMMYFPYDWELKIPLEVLLWLLFQSRSQVRQEMRKIGGKCLFVVLLLVTAILGVTCLRIEVATLLLLAPVVGWPLLTGSILRLNLVVVFLRLLSGISLAVLVSNRVFGETPDSFLISSVSIVLLFQFHMIFYIFKKSIDVHTKVIYLLIMATCLHVYLIQVHRHPQMQNLISYILVSLSLVSLLITSGTLLKRLMKIFLSLFVPVQMLSFRIESIFYFSVVLQMFTWVFIEYHGENSSILKFSPGIFSLRAVSCAKQASFSARKIAFFLIYVYVSYWALGNFPNLHSYDLYVLPNFFFKYPLPVSYFLAGVKFFLPFFIPTITFMVVSAAKERDADYQMITFLWASDMISCILIIFFGFLNKIFLMNIFPGKLLYVIIQQCGCICVILSFLAGRYLLFTSYLNVLKYIPWNRKTKTKSQKLPVYFSRMRSNTG
ncbi:hypothetical protein RUM44_000295 [Polyplax serrata]|uniref:GPI ethanolamine phosphate transferase 1 n=1 Tax=Polyplax serrata TaxID=468196 RepID=A0ABR1B516_POLSC